MKRIKCRCTSLDDPCATSGDVQSLLLHPRACWTEPRRCTRAPPPSDRLSRQNCECSKSCVSVMVSTDFLSLPRKTLRPTSCHGRSELRLHTSFNSPFEVPLMCSSEVSVTPTQIPYLHHSLCVVVQCHSLHGFVQNVLPYWSS